MELINFGQNIVALYIAAVLGIYHYEVNGQDICGKFGIGGPCEQAQPSATTTAEPVLHDNPYCQLVCAQGGSEQFSFACACGGEPTAAPTTSSSVTTETPKTTTEGPNLDNCQYISARPPQLSSKKRLFDPSSIQVECQYPGIVGLFSGPGTANQFAECNGLLVEENKLLITEGCKQTLNSLALYALTDSYQTTEVTASLPTVDVNTAQYLDTRGIFKDLYTVELSRPVTFDDRCVQPVCVPNTKFSAADIDFTDCRIVGYGVINDFFEYPTALGEILVEVDPASITEPLLTITRKDGQTGKQCAGDDGAPVICPHTETQEWITVGMTTGGGFPCSSGEIIDSRAINLLGEANILLYYNGLQLLKYAEP